MSESELINAARRNNLEEVRRLLDGGVVHVNETDAIGRTPLVYACQGGHADIVRLLLDKGAHKNQADKFGWTPLQMATIHGHEDVLRQLLKAGARLDPVCDRKTALEWAEWKEYSNIVELLREETVATAARDSKWSSPTGEFRTRMDLVSAIEKCESKLREANDVAGQMRKEVARLEAVQSKLQEANDVASQMRTEVARLEAVLHSGFPSGMEEELRTAPAPKKRIEPAASTAPQERKKAKTEPVADEEASVKDDDQEGPDINSHLPTMKEWLDAGKKGMSPYALKRGHGKKTP